VYHQTTLFAGISPEQDLHFCAGGRAVAGSNPVSPITESPAHAGFSCLWVDAEVPILSMARTHGSGRDPPRPDWASADFCGSSGCTVPRADRVGPGAGR
jgi:hypothetical protein